MQNYFENIQAYLEGLLKEKERQAFEAQLKGDTALQQAVAEHRVAYEAVDLLAQQKIKQDLRALQSERQKKARFTKRRWFIPAVAAGILLLVIAGFYFNLRSNYSDQGLFAQHFEPYSAAGVRGENTGDLTDKAFEAYERKNYEEAYNLFDKITPTSKDVGFFKGIAALKLQKNETAIANFLLVVESRDPQLMEVAQWYQALAFLQNHQENMAKTVLRSIASSSDHGYQRKAEKLLGDLNSKWR